MNAPIPDLVDQHLDAVLKACGSALRYYTMAKTLEDMRAAMRIAMTAATSADSGIDGPDNTRRFVPVIDGKPAAAQLPTLAVAAVQVLLAERIAELAKLHGSMRAAARALEIDHGYLSRLASGKRTDPGEELLKRMDLRETVNYERTQP